MKNILSSLWSRECPRRTARPALASTLETLEARIAPAAVATFNKGTLLVTGNPEQVLTISQTIEMISGVEVVKTTVTDGETPVGEAFYADAKNLVVKLDKLATDENTIVFNVQKVSGGVEVLAPKDAKTKTNVTINGINAADAVEIGRGIVVKGGSGSETVTVNNVATTGGIVFAAGKNYDSLYLTGNVSIGSNVGAVGATVVTLSAETSIQGESADHAKGEPRRIL